MLGLAMAVSTGACGDDGGSGDDGPAASTTNAGSTTAPASTGGGSMDDGTTASVTTGATTDPDSSSGGGDSSSSGGGPACDPPVVGEFNACMTADGSIDNTLCNWMGHPDGTGTLTCLSSSELEGANVCTIRGCEDVCDCFDAPPTGDAPVVCAGILEGGDNACGLDCSAGQTCPDGMECSSGLCFWPPA